MFSGFTLFFSNRYLTLARIIKVFTEPAPAIIRFEYSSVITAVRYWSSNFLPSISSKYWFRWT